MDQSLDFTKRELQTQAQKRHVASEKTA